MSESLNTEKLEKFLRLSARHAVAINEYRAPFDYVPMRDKQVTERFSAGSHTDVGGGYKNHTLADIAGCASRAARSLW